MALPRFFAYLPLRHHTLARGDGMSRNRTETRPVRDVWPEKPEEDLRQLAGALARLMAAAEADDAGGDA